MAATGLGKMKNKKNQDVKKPYDRPKSLLSRFGDSLREFFTAPRQVTLSEPCHPTDAAATAERPGAEEAAMDTGNRHQTSEDSGFNTRTTADGVVLEYGGYQATFDSKYDRCPTESEVTASARPGSSPLDQSGFGFTKQRSADRPPSTSGQPVGGQCLPGFGFARRSPDLQTSSSRNSTGNCSADLGLAGKRPARVPFSNAGTSEGQDKYGNPYKKQCVTPDIRDSVNRSKLSQKSSPAEKSFLWSTKLNRSHETNSSTLGCEETTASKKPRFDLDAFESALKNHDASLLSSNHRQSPYYHGKTTYGGASARQKLFRHLDAQCKAVPTVQRKVQVQPASLATSQAPLHSATARKIFDTLEQHSSSLQPGLDLDSSLKSGSAGSPLFFGPSAYRQNSTQATGRSLPATVGPPVHDRPTPTRAILRDNIQTSKPSADVTKLSGQSKAAQSSYSSGKKREPTREHYVVTVSEDDEEEMEPEDEPPVKTVVTIVSSGSTSTSSSSSGSEAKTAPLKTSTFTFSVPLRPSNNSGFNGHSEAKNFQFRSPITVDDHMTSSIVSTSMEVDPTSSSSKSSLAMNFDLGAAVKKPAPPVSSTPPSAGASGFGAFAPAKELKSGGVMDFLGRSTSSAPKTSGVSPPVSCTDAPQTVTTSASAAVSKPLSELFKTAANGWTCPTCFVSNNASMSECPCCETKRPGGTSTVPVVTSTVKAPHTSSETEKPKETSGANLPSLAELFKKPAGQWTCSVCSVPNKAEDSKCCACEEPKPGAAPEPLMNSNKNNSLISAPATHAATDGSNYKFTAATFGNGSQSVSSVSAASASSVTSVPSSGFQMSVPAGGFSGYSFGASFQPTEKGDSVVAPAGFKLPAGFTGFGIMKPSESNGASEKQKSVSFAVTSTSSEDPSGSENPANSLGNGGFSFKSNVEHVPGVTPEGFVFNSANFGGPSTKAAASTPGFQPGVKSSESATTVSQAPLDGAEKEKNVSSSTVVTAAPAKPGLPASSGFDGSKSSTGAVPAPLFDSARSGPAFGTGSSAESKVGFTNPFGSQGGGFGGILPTASSLPSSGLPQATSSASSSAAPVKTVSFGQSSTTGTDRTGDSAGPNVFAAGKAPPSNPPSVDASIFKFGQTRSDGAPSTVKPPEDNASKASDGVTSTSKFGQTASADIAAPVFKLGPAASDANRATAGGFQFPQNQPSQETKPSAFNAGNLFVFGQPLQNAASGNAFQFGFGAAANPPGTQPFGGFADNKSISTPAFGQQSTAAAAPASSSFGFVAPKFSLGAAPPESRPPNLTTHQGTKRPFADSESNTKRTRATSEDMQMQDEPAASGDFATSSTSTGFGFGCQQPPAASGSLFFGGALPNPSSAFQAAPPAPAPSFSFTGQQQTGFGAQSATNMGNGTVSTGLGFGASTAPSAPAFNFNSTPNFNFTGMPANQPTNVSFNAQPVPVMNSGRVIKKAVRRTNKH